jgi:hypothetical protein
MMLKATLDAEMDRLDGQIAALTRQRFADLSRCDLEGARVCMKQIRKIRRQEAALITGDLFPGLESQ